MSGFEAFGVIGAVWVATYFVFVRTDQHIHERGDAIITGTVAGVPMPMKNRWVMLFQHWIPNVAGQIVYCAVTLLVFYGLGRNVEDELARGLAYICAGVSAVAAVFWLILGTFYIFYLVSVIREAELD